MAVGLDVHSGVKEANVLRGIAMGSPCRASGRMERVTPEVH